MGEGSVDTIVNLAKGAWEVVKDGKPSATAQSAYCQAMPAKNQLAWEELSGWGTKSFKWSFSFSSYFDDWMDLDPTIDIDFYGEYQYNGQSEKAPGLFLNNFTVWCKRCDVDWGWTVNVDATTQGNPFNAGSASKPIGAIQLRVALNYSSSLMSQGRQWAFTCAGDGSFRQA